MADSWTRNIDGGRRVVTTPRTITTVVPVLNQSYGNFQFLTQTGTFPLSVVGTDDGLDATWTFGAANQSIYLGPAFRVTYDVATVNADNTVASTAPGELFLQFGAINLSSK